MAEQSLPPQTRRMAVYAAGGGFGGALLAIIVAKILSGPCCCVHPAHDVRQGAAAVSTAVVERRRSLPDSGA